LERVKSYLPEREFVYDPEDVGTQPLRFFVVEYLREAAFELLGDELPYAFTAEVEEFREAERPIYIRVTLFVERESQKGIVIGRSGGTIKAIGAHARARLEDLIGAPVYLDCWVKALPNWRKNGAALSRFGFPNPAPTGTSSSRSSHDPGA
jgi:GTP-binding protein Era